MTNPDCIKCSDEKRYSLFGCQNCLTKWRNDTLKLASKRVGEIRQKREEFEAALRYEVSNNPVSRAARLIALADQGFFGPKELL